MTPRRKIVLLTCAVLAGLAVTEWRSAGSGSTELAEVLPAPSQMPRAIAAQRRQTAGATGEVREQTVRSDALPLTRGEAAQRVRALYRREQLARELALEQRRYGRNYWESPPGGAAGQVQRERDAMLAELSAEATQVLHDFFPNENGDPVTLDAFFAADRPGPNVAFLSPGTRERFVAAVLANDDGRRFDAERLERIAEGVLSARELESYRRWNAPAAALLRTQLIGFDPTEAEFSALLRARNTAAADGEPPETELAAALGPERLVALQKMREPGLHAALGDLHRLGLPLEQGEWLAATRARAVKEIDEIWSNTTIGDLTKRERVGEAQRAYGQIIATRLGLRQAALDGLTPDS